MVLVSLQLMFKHLQVCLFLETMFVIIRVNFYSFLSIMLQASLILKNVYKSTFFNMHQSSIQLDLLVLFK